MQSKLCSVCKSRAEEVERLVRCFLLEGLFISLDHPDILWNHTVELILRIFYSHRCFRSL